MDNGYRGASCRECGGYEGSHFPHCPAKASELAENPLRAENSRLKALVTKHESALVWLAYNDGVIEPMPNGQYRVRYKAGRIGSPASTLLGAIETARDRRSKT